MLHEDKKIKVKGFLRLLLLSDLDRVIAHYTPEP